jgi:hypothetical protein
VQALLLLEVAPGELVVVRVLLLLLLPRLHAQPEGLGLSLRTYAGTLDVGSGSSGAGDLAPCLLPPIWIAAEVPFIVPTDPWEGAIIAPILGPCQHASFCKLGSFCCCCRLSCRLLLLVLEQRSNLLLVFAVGCIRLCLVPVVDHLFAVVGLRFLLRQW